MDSRLGAAATFDGAAIVAGVQTGAPLHVTPDTVLHQMPMVGRRVRVVVFGLGDDPKQRWDARGATYMNQTWEKWLAEAGVTPEQVWPHATPNQRSLWNARLYPVATDWRKACAWRCRCRVHPPPRPAGWMRGWPRSWSSVGRRRNPG